MQRIHPKQDFVAEPFRDRIAKVFDEVRKTQLSRATADAFVRQAVAYIKKHGVVARVAVDTLLTPSVIREAARGLTGPLSDIALIEFARKGVLRAIEEAEALSEATK